MNYFNTKQGFLISSFSLEKKEVEKIDKFLNFIDKSEVLKQIESEEKDQIKGGRPNYNQSNLFAAVLYCFTFGKGSLRNIEEMCHYDLRVIYIMDGEMPTHMTISNFINEKIKPNIRSIYSSITKAIIKECGIDNSTIFIDGSKFEADANKYKFVWKPIKFHNKLSDKIRTILNKHGIDRGIPSEGIIPVDMVAKKLNELAEKLSVYNLELKENRQYKDDFETMSIYLGKSIEYEEKEKICGEKRNSYYKTDKDATAMCLKEDYYSGLGSNMHAAYNAQLGVSDGIIIWCMVSQSRNDYDDFIPFLEDYEKEYGMLPINVVADAGYGSLKNYRYMKTKNITSYVKHSSWEGNVSGRNPFPYRVNSDKTITCLNGNIGQMEEIEGRHVKNKDSYFYRVEGCSICSFSSFCKRYMSRKDADFRIFEVNEELRKLIQESETNLLSAKGIEMRVNRSSQVEGAFGIIKQDFGYERFRRTGIDNVSMEFMLVCLGFNIRKLFRFYSGNLKKKYWVAPEGLCAEHFKKPSAKRLVNRVNKKVEKSINQLAKDSYKYSSNK